MGELKPKEWHERHLASADREKIVQHLENDQDQAVTKIAVILARQCDLLVHFQRLWLMRVADLDEMLSTERYMKRIFVNRRELYRELVTGAQSS